MIVLCINYVYIITIFELIDLGHVGCVKHLAVSCTGIFIMYMLCNLFCELCMYYEYS